MKLSELLNKIREAEEVAEDVTSKSTNLKDMLKNIIGGLDEGQK